MGTDEVSGLPPLKSDTEDDATGPVVNAPAFQSTFADAPLSESLKPYKEIFPNELGEDNTPTEDVYWSRARIRWLLSLVLVTGLFVWDQVFVFNFILRFRALSKTLDGPAYVVPLGIQDKRAAWSTDCEALYADNIDTMVWYDCDPDLDDLCVTGVVPLLAEWHAFLDRHQNAWCPLGRDWASMGRYVKPPEEGPGGRELTSGNGPSVGSPIRRLMQREGKDCPPPHFGPPPPDKPPIPERCCIENPDANYCTGEVGSGGDVPQDSPPSGGSTCVSEDPESLRNTSGIPFYSRQDRDFLSCPREGVLSNPAQEYLGESGTKGYNSTAPPTCNNALLEEMSNIFARIHKGYLERANPADYLDSLHRGVCRPTHIGVGAAKSFCYFQREAFDVSPPEYQVPSPPSPEYVYPVKPNEEHEREWRVQLRKLTVASLAVFSIAFVVNASLFIFRIYRCLTAKGQVLIDKLDYRLSFTTGLSAISFQHLAIVFFANAMVDVLRQYLTRCYVNVRVSEIQIIILWVFIPELISSNLALAIRIRCNMKRLKYFWPLIFYTTGANIMVLWGIFRALALLDPYVANPGKHLSFFICAGIVGILIPISARSYQVLVYGVEPPVKKVVGGEELEGERLSAKAVAVAVKPAPP